MGHIVFANGHDQGPLLARVSLAMYTVAVTFVALRCFTRACIVKRFGLDDVFIAIATVLGAAQTVTIILQVEHGQGRHTTELRIEQFNHMLMYQWINMLIYFVANWAVKMSILALYYRIGYGRKGLPWIVQAPAVWTVAGFMTAFGISSFTAQLFLCVPISRIWDIVHANDGGCIDVSEFMITSAAINVATDIVLLMFPLPLLRLFKFNRRQRTALVVVLSVGLIPVIASTMRLCEIIMAGRPIKPGKGWQDNDYSWGWAWVPVWSQIEVDVSILAASLPCLYPLFKHVFHPCSRPATPSEMPTLPGYPESWAEQDLVSRDGSEDLEKNRKSFDFEDEKRLTVREKEMGKGIDINISVIVDKEIDVGEDVVRHRYDDDLSAVAEEDDAISRLSVDLAKPPDVQKLTRVQTGDPTGIEYKKL
ncbi:hypothetical protein COCVIDRAFT_14926 [Bipolaris victoriae FI3]|uniref:Rhodopsin domain-containing protein n=2 Tax=Bipolaris TaxID=33194 RepID=W6YNY9_COCC2|nr:uncharacterized protein COCCADRAFT_33478 [Bipolaris zeicola 26-R-13]XP_014557786.1 hypothetical protein COCVIDRAFT_14926 [Bipolaris victoriae FI3]EUC37204.1 hypothetical protein COCCADRAFT_33478 [Bipolaris zeicola 26-R-13]